MPEFFVRYKIPGMPEHFKALKAASRVDAIDAMKKWHGIPIQDITDIREMPDRVPAGGFGPKREPGRKIRVLINRVRLNQGGYDSRGKYFGIGAPLFLYYSDPDEEGLYGHVRASDRASAKEKVRQIVLNQGYKTGEFSVR